MARPPRATVVLALLLCACGQPRGRTRAGAADSAAASAAIDTTAHGPKACDLLTADDITRVTHVAMKPGITTNDYAGDSQCRYDAVDTAKSAVMLSLHERGRIEPYAKVPGSFGVAGLGDTAIWNPGNAQLAVRDSAAVFSISFLKPPARQQWAVQLGRSALRKRHP